MKYYFFHLMSWPYLPADFSEKHDSAWVWCPNDLFDPVRGQELYQAYIDTLVMAEDLGFDGVCVNEHHQNAYGLMPSPNLIAAALTQRTKRMKIAVIGNALPMYNPPVRVAEEFAMLDVLSKGRLIAGLVVGGGPEYYSYQINPTHAREKFREAMELILKAWTEPGPFMWNSKHYFYRYVNPWPLPYQKPHPPVWIPGMGSIETLEMVAARRFCYMGIPFFNVEVSRKMFNMFRDCCRKAGYEADPGQMGWGVPVYVAENDAKARAEFEPHLRYFVENCMKGLMTITPPGYTSAKSAMAVLKAKQQFLSPEKTWKEIEDGAYAIVGSPATVRDKLNYWRKELGVGNILTGCQAGSLPHDLARKSMTMFAKEVLPHIRDDVKPAAKAAA